MQENKARFKFCLDNDPQHRSSMLRMWLPYNCVKVISTPIQGSHLNPIENLRVYFKENICTR